MNQKSRKDQNPEVVRIRRRLSYLKNMPRHLRTWDDEDEIRMLERRLYAISSQHFPDWTRS